MSELQQLSVPSIPVLDERLDCPSSAPPSHREKVELYNELLEDIYLREVELTKYRATLVDMRSMIAEEADILEHGIQGKIMKPVLAQADSSSSSEGGDESQVLSDSGSSDVAIKDKKNRSRSYSKRGKGNKRSSKVPGSELDVKWDYQLKFGHVGGLRRRGSDASL